MRRYHDWRVRLRDYVEATRSRPFCWGRFDCCLFACNAVRSITGVDMAAEWRGTYRTKTGAWRITNGNLEAFVDRMALRHGLSEIRAGEVSAGDPVFTKLGGGSLGIIGFEGLPTFAHSHGLCLQARSAIARAWKIE